MNLNSVDMPMSGQVLANLIVNFVEEINKPDGAIPNLSTAWDALVQTQIENCFQKQMSKIQSEFKNIQLPQNEETLRSQVERAKSECSPAFDRLCNDLASSQVEFDQIQLKKQ